jgi:hypothetical protein
MFSIFVSSLPYLIIRKIEKTEEIMEIDILKAEFQKQGLEESVHLLDKYNW